MRHAFPDHIVLEGSGMILIEDAMMDRVHKGDTILGWEGEEQLAVYLDVENASWNLLRWCQDHYRVLARFSARAIPTADIVPTIVLWLVEHDSRRGFTTEQVHLANEAREAEVQKALDEWASEGADRLVHAAKDL